MDQITRTMDLSGGDMYRRFDVIPECDRQRDKRTDERTYRQNFHNNTARIMPRDVNYKHSKTSNLRQGRRSREILAIALIPP